MSVHVYTNMDTINKETLRPSNIFSVFLLYFQGKIRDKHERTQTQFSLKMSDTTVHQCVHYAYNALRLIEKEQKCYCQWKASSNRTWLVQYFKRSFCEIEKSNIRCFSCSYSSGSFHSVVRVHSWRGRNEIWLYSEVQSSIMGKDLKLKSH